jgi:hypothetical protein
VEKFATPTTPNQRLAYEVVGGLLRASCDFGKGEGCPPTRPCVRIEEAAAEHRAALDRAKAELILQQAGYEPTNWRDGERCNPIAILVTGDHSESERFASKVKFR